MDEEIERLVVAVRADTTGFTRDVDALRGQLDGPFADSAGRAGRTLESALAKAVRSGKLGFDELKSVALQVFAEIAASAIRSGLNSILGSFGFGGATGGSAGDFPGRATGGPVSPGRPYLVGERGPELFVPTTAGRIAAAAQAGGDRNVAITVNVMTSAGSDTAQALTRSARQVARAVRQALD